MFVYIWKDLNGIPFYVGLTKRIGRTNPRNNGNRNWLTRQKLEQVGTENVIVEFHTVPSIVEGQEMERLLISRYGRLQTATGPLTNLRPGGEGTQSPTILHREKLREAMLNPNHPCRSPEARAKQLARIRDPEVRKLFSGDKNPAKKPEVREKLKAMWKDSEYCGKQATARIGKSKNFSAEFRAKLTQAVKDNPDMKSWSQRNGKDPEFDAKRIEGIRAAQPKRAEKMRDPLALAQRKERLKATMNSPEYKAKRALYDTPEYRAKLSEAKRAYWANKRLMVI